jgi:DNA-binding LytR/AlgR family response regulator
MIKLNPTAIIAEDEPILAMLLQRKLATEWSNLSVVAMVGDGQSAVEKSLIFKPDVLFFDIRMPGLTGIEAAQTLLDTWPDEPFPALVFVTAYDEFVIKTNETMAIDFLSKPIQTAALQKIVAKLQFKQVTATAHHSKPQFQATLTQLAKLSKA